MSTPSALVAERYRLVKMLGAGGMGIVWQAWDTRLRRPVALKMLRTQPELTDEERQIATDRAMREAQITAGLHHPHAVTVYDVVEHDDQPCIVMQLLESTPLSELLRERGAFPPDETARIGAQVASALAAAHRLKIVHRDVKPGNILITADGSAMISDFGISHALGDATITATGMIHGTPAYLAPEVARGLPTSFASDVFSLGSTLYAVVEGEPPFGTDRNSIALLHRVARGGYPAPRRAGPLAPLLRKMLAAQPKRRPSMESVADALAGIGGEEDAGERGAAAGLVALGFDAPTVGQPVPEAETEVPVVETVAPEAETVAPEAETVAPEAETAAGSAPDAVEASVTAPQPDASPGAAAVTADPGPATPPTERLPTGATVPIDEATARDVHAAETERLAPAAAGASAAVSEHPTVPAEGDRATAPGTTRRRAGVIAGVLALLVAVGLGAAFLFASVQGDPGVADPATSETADADPAPTSEPETESPAASTPQSTAPPPEEQPEPTPAPVTPEQRVVDTIAGYYALMPEDRESAWPLMTADYQENHAGGRDGYEAFWSQVADLTVTDVSASGPDSGQATLTYTFRDGRVVEEVTAYRFQDEGGVLKIAASDVISSRDL
ncbi:protein kinase [Microbacterium sp. NPDC056736]|uniref:serine/threonine-protein kinase n=1 Tax=Microbacterium sp. NPDC056736 TaxID=3345932 RepID=UPI00366A94BC